MNKDTEKNMPDLLKDVKTDKLLEALKLIHEEMGEEFHLEDIKKDD